MLKIIVLLCALAVGSETNNFPSSIQRCAHADKVCIANVMSEVMKAAGDFGVPELGVVQINPYELKNVIVEKGDESPINIKIHFKRVNITGLHTILVDKIIGFDEDPKSSKFEMHGHCDVARIYGPYQISGKVLLLPIAGRGSSNIAFEKVRLKVSLKTRVETRNGEDYLSVYGATVKLDTKKLQINLENLFNNKELSDAMNAILNENDELIFKELQVPLQNVLEDVVHGLVSPVFDKFPYKDMFLK